MTQACTPYKTPATRHHTQSKHQSAEAHTTSIIRDQLLSLVSGLSLTQSTGPRSASTSTAATPSLRLGAVDPSGSRARPRAWRGDNQPPHGRGGGPSQAAASWSPRASTRADPHASRRQAPAGRPPNSACCGSWPWRPCRRSRSSPCPPGL